MRPIKFRGQCKASKEWVYGSYLHTKHAFRDEILHKIIPFEVDKVTEIIPETLGQFTGLLDKNGNEIYEGDILKGNFNIPIQVYFSNGQFKANTIGKDKQGELTWHGHAFRKTEIIGNIHEHKHLLEQ